MPEEIKKEIDALIKILGLGCSIKEFEDIVNWRNISEFQKLSEDFIRAFQHKLDWKCISAYQKLDEELIIEFQYKINWHYLSINKNTKLSKRLISRFQQNIDFDTMRVECFKKCIEETGKIDNEYAEEIHKATGSQSVRLVKEREKKRDKAIKKIHDEGLKRADEMGFHKVDGSWVKKEE